MNKSRNNCRIRKVMLLCRLLFHIQYFRFSYIVNLIPKPICYYKSVASLPVSFLPNVTNSPAFRKQRSTNAFLECKFLIGFWNRLHNLKHTIRRILSRRTYICQCDLMYTIHAKLLLKWRSYRAVARPHIISPCSILRSLPPHAFLHCVDFPGKIVSPGSQSRRTSSQKLTGTRQKY